MQAFSDGPQKFSVLKDWFSIVQHPNRWLYLEVNSAEHPDASTLNHEWAGIKMDLWNGQSQDGEIGRAKLVG